MTTPVVRPAQRIKPPSCYCSHSPLDTGAIPKKQHRHSGIFRVADLGPGTMPRGKYPESPAPAGSHALISRTPTPGGMLHANLGLPRPPPRNFQPPLPRFPSRLSPRRMSGMTIGGGRWEVAGRGAEIKKIIVIPDIISRKRKENIRNLRRKAGMTPHWRECEAPLRRTQRDGADETILCRSQAPVVAPRGGF